jgi:hypothetical protein
MSSLGSRIASDFTFYMHNGFILIRPETARAQQHVEQNRAEYEKWLFKFYFGDGSSILFGPGPGGGIYLKPKADYRTLGETLVNRGFIVVRDEEANPPFVRLVAGSAYGNKSPWLLHINNCRMPRELSKMVIRGAGKPN